MRKVQVIEEGPDMNNDGMSEHLFSEQEIKPFLSQCEAAWLDE
jgi:hypothetical protein